MPDQAHIRNPLVCSKCSHTVEAGTVVKCPVCGKGLRPAAAEAAAVLGFTASVTMLGGSFYWATVCRNPAALAGIGAAALGLYAFSNLLKGDYRAWVAAQFVLAAGIAGCLTRVGVLMLASQRASSRDSALAMVVTALVLELTWCLLRTKRVARFCSGRPAHRPNVPGSPAPVIRNPVTCRRCSHVVEAGTTVICPVCRACLRPPALVVVSILGVVGCLVWCFFASRAMHESLFGSLGPAAAVVCALAFGFLMTGSYWAWACIQAIFGLNMVLLVRGMLMTLTGNSADPQWWVGLIPLGLQGLAWLYLHSEEVTTFCSGGKPHTETPQTDAEGNAAPNA